MTRSQRANPQFIYASATICWPANGSGEGPGASGHQRRQGFFDGCSDQSGIGRFCSEGTDVNPPNMWWNGEDFYHRDLLPHYE